MFERMDPETASASSVYALVALSEANPPVDETKATETLVSYMVRYDNAVMHNVRDMTVLECSIRYSSYSFTKLLLQKLEWDEKTVTKAFLVSSYLRLIDSCKLLYATELVDINATYTDGFNALQMSIIYEDVAMVRWLLQTGADVTVQSPAGTPNLLLTLMRSKNLEITKLLVEHGANVHERSYHISNTAVILAADSGDAEILQYVLSIGCSPHLQNNYGKTALQAAMSTKCFNARNVHLLLDAGVDVNVRNFQGLNAMEELFRCDTNAAKLFNDPPLWNRLVVESKADISRILSFYVGRNSGYVRTKPLAALLRMIPENARISHWMFRLVGMCKKEWEQFLKIKLDEQEAIKTFHLVDIFSTDISRYIKSFLFEKGMLKRIIKESKFIDK
jgi:hypothetical protein